MLHVKEWYYLKFVSCIVLQSLQEKGVEEILSSGSSSHQDKKERQEGGDPTALRKLGTGRLQAPLVMFTHQITE